MASNPNCLKSSDDVSAAGMSACWARQRPLKNRLSAATKKRDRIGGIGGVMLFFIHENSNRCRCIFPDWRNRRAVRGPRRSDKSRGIHLQPAGRLALGHAIVAD